MSITAGGSPAGSPDQRSNLAPVARWLWLCAGMVFVMALIGAITRLTESGLSIVEWRPLGGAIPPLTAADWQRLFDEYRHSPQYRQINAGMSLQEFRGIFWWEWVHRQWGRLIGLVFALPLLWFAVTRRIRGPLLLKCMAVLALGGLQAFIGWFMVASGLIDRPSVSHYRLALHLGLATLLMALLILLALGVNDRRRFQKGPPGLRTHALAGYVLLFTTLVWGAFVAGLDAGLIYNEFPRMGAGLFPSEGLDLQPVWLNFFENHAAVQFAHRWLALTTATVIFILGVEAVCSPVVTVRARRLGWALMLMVGVQVALGITTLLTQVQIHAAVSHQGGALTLVALMTALLYELRGKQA